MGNARGLGEGGRRVRVELLGGFRVLVDGAEVGEWQGRRAVELVQLLAMSPRRQRARDEVIEALWPQLEPDAGAANLRKAAHYARAALGSAESLVLRGGQVALLPDGELPTDVDEFEDRAKAALAAGEADGCREAAEDYRGELLPDSLYEEWTQAPRARLRSTYVELLRCAGDWERLVAVEPTDEAAYRELMRRELATGGRPAAIRWYGRLRTALRRELGIPPDAQTQALYDECVGGLGVDDAVLVGRELELARASALLRGEWEGHVATLVIRGPAGIGKSALCRRLGQSGRDLGWATVSVAAFEAGTPYGPLTAAIEQLLDARPGIAGELGERTCSVLAELTPLAPAAPPLGRPLTRHEAIGALGRLLGLAGDPGVVFLVDDAHLADEATLDALTHLASVGAQRTVLVLAYRPEPAPEALRAGVAMLARRTPTVELDLEPLEPEDAAALVVAAAPTRRAPDVVERIVELAQGNPFLALEAARSPVAGVPSLVATARDAVLARFVDLERQETAALARLALAGDALDPVSVVALSGSGEADAFALLDRALDAGVLVVAEARYRFRHELVRQALVESMAPHTRAATHREIAGLLGEVGAEPALVAHQWLDGGRPTEATGWLLDAAEQAMRLGAFADAVAHLDRLLEHEPEHPDALTMRAEALDALGEMSAPEAYELAAVTIGGQAAHELRAKQGLAQVKRGDPPGGLRTLEGIEPKTVDGRLAQALAHCGAAALGYGDPEVGAAKAAEAKRLALKTGDSDSLVIASWAHAAAAHARGDLRANVQADLRDTQALPRLAVNVFDGQLCITQRLLYGARPYPDVIAFADAFEAEAERLGAARGQAFAATIRGEARLLAGDLEGADADLTTGVALHRSIGAATGEAFALQRRSEVALLRGDRAEGESLLDEALAVARESDVGFHLFDRIYGTRVAAAGEPEAGMVALEEAEAAVRGPIETCPGCRITLAVPAAIAAAKAGDVERASRWKAESEFLADVVMRLPAWYAAMDEVRAHLALAEGNRDEAGERFRAAASAFAEAGQPLDSERCAQAVVSAVSPA